MFYGGDLAGHALELFEEGAGDAGVAQVQNDFVVAFGVGKGDFCPVGAAVDDDGLFAGGVYEGVFQVYEVGFAGVPLEGVGAGEGGEEGDAVGGLVVFGCGEVAGGGAGYGAGASTGVAFGDDADDFDAAVGGGYQGVAEGGGG